MKDATRMIARLTVLVCTAVLSGWAQAHTGHETSTLMQGLAHPFGADHLLAMVAVGLWSAAVLPTGKVWQGPATFLAALVLSAVLGAAGVTMPLLEHAIALSVVLFGAMVVLSHRQAPAYLGLGLVAVAASLHGLAHGAEAPAGGFGGYVLGFLVTTAALHGAGLAAGLGVRSVMARQSAWAMRAAGTMLGGAGVYLFSQI